MNWTPHINGFKAYLLLERSLSENSIEAYSCDVEKLERFLINHKYDATTYVTYNEDALIVPTESCPKALLDDIYNYFAQRNEDSIYNKKIEL